MTRRQTNSLPRSRPARFVWCWITQTNILRAGRQYLVGDLRYQIEAAIRQRVTEFNPALLTHTELR
jgi:hypothetical protein